MLCIFKTRPTARGCAVQDSLTQVLSMDDPRHGPPPPERRIRKAVHPTEASRRQSATPLSPITHEQLSPTSSATGLGLCDEAISSCRRRNLSTWDTTNTITGQTLPYSVPEHRLQLQQAWVQGMIQDSVAPPPPAPDRMTVDQIVHV